jgi:dihydroorotase
MPNTAPAIDNQEVVQFIRRRAAGLPVTVYPVGTISKGRKGQELSEFGDLTAAGAVAVSDDGDWVHDGNLMRRALEYARMFKIPVISHCEDETYAAHGCMNEGAVSTVLGMRAIPRIAEETAVARDIAIAAFTGGRLHIAHISTAEAVAAVRAAKARGVSVTAETAPHYLCLDEELVRSFDTNFKMNPPLRTQADIAAVKEGLRDGTIDCIATDHAPHASEEKDVEFDQAPFGIIGLETALPVCLRELVDPGLLTLAQLIDKLSYAPARILNVPKPGIRAGQRADITIFDPARTWTVTPESLQSRSKNSPFLGASMTGKVIGIVTANSD